MQMVEATFLIQIVYLVMYIRQNILNNFIVVFLTCFLTRYVVVVFSVRIVERGLLER